MAIGEKLTESCSSLFIIERHSSFGQESSSRNSEVIHAGIYYPKGSLKGSLCIEGKNLLYDYCRKYDVPHNNCGKLIVATTREETTILSDINHTAKENGLHDLVEIDQNEIAAMEPNIFALRALYSPSTGIIDSHLLMKQYETNTINNGGQIVYGSEVKGIRKIHDGYEITLLDADRRNYTFTSGIVINSAGLMSDKISALAGIYDENLKINFCKGEYFRVKPPKNKLVNRLIYPVPHKNMEGIGIHVTIDMGGGVKLGPDVKFLESNVYDYTLTDSKQEYFFNAASKYLPFLNFDDIAPEMAGIRSKIQKPGDPQRDFYINEESERGYPGFINLIGMESPALTSSIAIANYVKKLVENRI